VAAAIGVPVAALADVELEFPLGAGPDPLAAVGEAEARRSALLERSDVRAALDVYAASEAALRLELARQYPDLHLGTGYQFDQGQNKWGLGIALELPLLNRNEGPIAEAIAARSEAAARFTALQAQVIAELEQGLAERRGALDQVAQLDERVALQESQVARARDALALGAIDRPALLASELELRGGELARVDARQALEQSYAALEAALQGPLLTPDALDHSRRQVARGSP
jgi:outer membrane protein TolC